MCRKWSDLAFKTRLALVIVPLLVIAAACALFRAASGPRPIRNVVLISIDTCRSDHLSGYGFGRPTTPNLDRLAQAATLFTHAVTPVPLTFPAHSSMLTGTLPLRHGVHDNLNSYFDPSNTTLAQVLRARGFHTGAIVSAYVLNSVFGLNKGFDDYDDTFKDDAVAAESNERRGEETTRLGLTWLEKNKDRRFFLFLHYYDLHFPYTPPAPFDRVFAESPYDGELAYVDQCIGQVIEKLKSLGLYDSTVLVVTGDHGEMLGEHGEPTHGFFVYRAAMEVPLIIRWPGQTRSSRVDQRVGLIDIVPTVCGMLSIPVPEGVQGEDLSGYLHGRNGPRTPRALYCESLTPTRYLGNSLLSVVIDRWEYIQTTRPELYDLTTDPGEKSSLSSVQPQRARILQDRLKQILAQGVRGPGPGAKAVLDESSRKRLESLGYIGSSSVAEEFTFDHNRPDPKDVLDLYLACEDATTCLAKNRLAEARAKWDQIHRQQPKLFDAPLSLGKIALLQKDYQTALRWLEQALAIDPNHHHAHNLRAMALVHLGRRDEAVKEYETSLRLLPHQSPTLFELGNLLFEGKKFNQAADVVAQGLALKPDQFKARYVLAIALVESGQFEEGLRQFDQAISVNSPSQARVANYFGSLLSEKGRADLAVGCFQKALRQAPELLDARENLAKALADRGKTDEAVVQYQEILRRSPDAFAIHNEMALLCCRQEKFGLALEYGRQSLAINPNQPLVLNGMAGIHYRQGHLEQAQALWREALKRQPDWPEVMNRLAWLKAVDEDVAVHNPAEAVQLSRRACELTGNQNPAYLDTLAAAYAANGQFSQAVKTADQALTLARSLKQDTLAKEIQARRTGYQNGKAHVQALPGKAEH